MRYFLGNPRWCSAEIMVGGRLVEPADAHPATEPLGQVAGDRLKATFGFDNGVFGTFTSAKNEHGNGGRWGVDLCGSKGIISLRTDSLGNAGYFPEPAWDRGARNVQWQPLPDAPPAEFKSVEAERYRPITIDLIESIRRDRNPSVSLQDGRDALEMVQAVYASHFKAARVELPLKDRVHPIAEG
jgi:predicted dehydrogenase